MSKRARSSWKRAKAKTSPAWSCLRWSAPVNGKTQVLLTFGGDLIDAGGSLADGEYRLRILDSHIRDAAGNELDINGDGQSGAAHVDEFFRLLGDGDGDRSVGLFDFARFRATYGLNASDNGFNDAFDLDANGVVNLFDFALFRGNFGEQI